MTRPTEDRLETILALVRGGAGVAEAAAHAGLDPLEFDRWLRRPRSGDVRARIQRARAQADLTDLGIIGSAAKDSWQAAKARMELRREREAERHVTRLRDLTAD